jgi:hypothetical protein
VLTCDYELFGIRESGGAYNSFSKEAYPGEKHDECNGKRNPLAPRKHSLDIAGNMKASR